MREVEPKVAGGYDGEAGAAGPTPSAGNEDPQQPTESASLGRLQDGHVRMRVPPRGRAAAAGEHGVQARVPGPLIRVEKRSTKVY